MGSKNLYFFSLGLLTASIVFITEKYINSNLAQLDQTASNSLERTKISNESYVNKCVELYKKIRFPDESLFHRPALKQPPDEMLDEFTMNGQMPILKWYYKNEIYSDSKSANQDQNLSTRRFSIADIETIRSRVRQFLPLGYGDTQLNKMMHSYSWAFRNKKMAVIGTQGPWIESIGIELGASLVVTLEYTKATYEDPRMKWLHVNEYLDNAIGIKSVGEFDVVVSFSSLEHSGLGRYGDPINPNGDLEGVRQVHCMLKPGGLFFLGLPTSLFGSSYIEFNAHRVYGKARLDVMFSGWRLLARRRETAGFQKIFLLEKI